MDEEKYKLKKLIEQLSRIRGRHTELVSFYIPAGYNLATAANQISSELSTSQNVKSKTVRTNVGIALERILAELRKYNKTPDNGLVIFSGNVSEVEGKPDYKIWTIIPPEKINVKIYRCDQKFITEPLQDLVEEKRTFGLVVLDTREVTLGILNGKNIRIIKSMESNVMGKFKAGGQSAPRFHREREEQIKEFFKDVNQLMMKSFGDNPNIIGIIIGGPGPAKEEFVEGGYLHDYLRKKIIGIKDIGYTDEEGIYELVNKSQDLLEKEAIMEEKRILDKFFTNIAKDNGMSVYGELEIRKKLELGAVEILIISDSLPLEKADEFSNLAHKFSTEVIFVSESTNEGKQLKEMGGLGAILRYKL